MRQFGAGLDDEEPKPELLDAGAVEPEDAELSPVGGGTSVVNSDTTTGAAGGGGGGGGPLHFSSRCLRITFGPAGDGGGAIGADSGAANISCCLR